MHRSFPELEMNDFVDFQGELFPVCGDLLSVLSSPFRESRLGAGDRPKPYQIPPTLPRTSVLAFLKPFQKGEMEITPQNAPDLLILCDEFQLPSYRRSIEQFVCSQGGNLLISSLLALSREGKGTSSLEASLNSGFPDFADLLNSVESDHDATLPIQILCRIVKFPPPTQEEAFRRVFEFCLRVFDSVGSSGSILFRTLDLRHLGRNYFHLLRERPTFDWSFFSSSFCDTLLDCQSHYESLISTHKQQEAASDKMGIIVSDVESRLKSVENRQNSFGLKTDLDNLSSRVNSLVSTSASKSEFDSLKSIVSVIQREFESFRVICAVKEEVDTLRSSSVPKTEWILFAANCATKNDLDSLKSVSVKQSDFETLRREVITAKAELNSLKTSSAANSELESLKVAAATKSELNSWKSIAEMKSDLESLRQSITAKSDFDSFRTTTQTALTSLKQESATKTELNSLNTAAATKSELDSLKSIAAIKSDLESLRQLLTAKSDFDSFRTTTQMELTASKQGSATKTEFNSFKAAAATKAELDGLRSTTVSKTELDSMKSGWAAKSDLDLVQRGSATNAALSELRNRLDAVVARSNLY
jgi:hypothetical protein